MKKRLFFALVLLIAGAVFVMAGGGREEPEPDAEPDMEMAEDTVQLVTITVNPFFEMSFNPNVPPPKDFITAEVEKKYPNIQLEFLAMPNMQQIHDLYVNWFINKDETADVLWYTAPWTKEFDDAGWLVPLEGVLDRSVIDGIIPEYLDVFRNNDGELFAIGPHFAGIGGLYYRKDLLEEYGIPVPKTYDDVIKACDIILAENPDLTGWGWPGVKDGQLTYRFGEVLHGFGGEWVDSRGKCAVNSPEGIKALQFMIDLIEKGYSPPDVLSWAEADAHARFVNGDVIFQTGRQDLLFWLDDPERSKIAGKWGFMPNPAQRGGRRSGFFDAWGMGINAYSDAPEAAAQVVEVLGSFEVMKKFILAWGPIQGHKDVYTDPEVLESNPMITMMDPVAATALRAYPAVNYGESVSILVDELHGALAGGKSAKEALDTAAKMIDEANAF